MSIKSDVVVIGGGLAGLTAAARAAEEGASVVLLEGGKAPGGRALTQVKDGFHFNMGPHALYVSAAAAPVLKRLGVGPRGSKAPLDAALAIDNGKLTTLPATMGLLAKTKALGVMDKIEFGKFLAGLPKLDTTPFAEKSFEETLQIIVKRPRVRRLLEAFARLTSYANAPGFVSGKSILDQVATGGDGVLYLDKGWQSLVDDIRDVNLDRGVSIRCSARAAAITEGPAGLIITLKSGEAIKAQSVILAVPPAEALRLTQGMEIDGEALNTCTPVRLASLDLGLSSLPEPTRTFALGLDAPTYLSVHSSTARLAPGKGAVIHVARYLAPGEDIAAGDLERELEEVMNLVQPGWRALEVHRIFRPNLTVTYALPLAENGGLEGRPAVDEFALSNIFVAGDWVGPVGMLADAAIASGDEAGNLAASSARDTVGSKAA